MRRRHHRQQRNDILRLRRLLFKGKSQKPALRHSHFPCRVLFRRGHRLPFRKDITITFRLKFLTFFWLIMLTMQLISCIINGEQEGGYQMSYTKFAEFMRILRIKNHENMGDTAKLLDVNVSFLSAVETGKKNVPMNWVEKIVNHYKLSNSERLDLLAAIEDSKTTSKIDLVSTPDYKRQVALQFQRSFDDIDETTAKKIMELLEV